MDAVETTEPFIRVAWATLLRQALFGHSFWIAKNTQNIAKVKRTRRRPRGVLEAFEALETDVASIGFSKMPRSMYSGAMFCFTSFDYAFCMFYQV